MPDFHVRFRFEPLGAVTMADGKPTFPSGPSKPGVWRVTAGSAVWYGASKNLRMAMYQLTGPGPTQTTNQRVHDLAMDCLRSQQPVHVDIITSAERRAQDRWIPLDFDDEDVRTAVKAAAATTAADRDDPDPDSAAYRAALGKAQRAVGELVATDLMHFPPTDRPVQPATDPRKLLGEAARALRDLDDEYGRYWNKRWGHEGNPPAR